MSYYLYQEINNLLGVTMSNQIFNALYKTTENLCKYKFYIYVFSFGCFKVTEQFPIEYLLLITTLIFFIVTAIALHLTPYKSLMTIASAGLYACNLADLYAYPMINTVFDVIYNLALARIAYLVFCSTQKEEKSVDC